MAPQGNSQNDLMGMQSWQPMSVDTSARPFPSTRPTFSKSIMALAAASKFSYNNLIFVEPWAKINSQCTTKTWHWCRSRCKQPADLLETCLPSSKTRHQHIILGATVELLWLHPDTISKLFYFKLVSSPMSVPTVSTCDFVKCPCKVFNIKQHYSQCNTDSTATKTGAAANKTA